MGIRSGIRGGIGGGTRGIVRRVCCLLATLLAASLAAFGGDGPGLAEAVQRRDMQAVQSFLNEPADVNARQADGTTALAWAAHWDDLETAELLIQAGADVNASNDHGVTPLSLACTNGSAAMVKKLLEAGADPNAVHWTGETALMECARTGSAEAVKLLLARGADPNARENREGQTALMWALAGKHSNAAQSLIEHGADVQAKSKGGFTPLLFAAQQGDVETARMLLAAGAGVNESAPAHGSPLVVASASGHEEFALFLLEKGADPDAADTYGITALHHAVQEGLSFLTGVVFDDQHRVRPSNLPRLVKALLERGANPNAQITKGYPRGTRAPDSAPIGMIGATPFFLAALGTDAGIMRILAEAGADPRLPSQGNISPLMAAAGVARDATKPRKEAEKRKALEAVTLAVDLGVDVNAASANGQTAMHAAAFTGGDSLVQFLAGHGAAVDVEDNSGETPWSMAAGVSPVLRYRGLYGSYQSTADLLLKLGATPRSRETMDTLSGASKPRPDSQENHQAPVSPFQ